MIPGSQDLSREYRFCIKMPMLHRLACFRDDVVFLIFLYQVSSWAISPYVSLDSSLVLAQRWIYRIDPKRVNEYGQVMAEDVIKADDSGETKKEK